MEFTKYEHHGEKVWVRKNLKGKHSEYCLCHQCKNFKPNSKRNCSIAKKLYKVCCEENLVTPVWECKEFEKE